MEVSSTDCSWNWAGIEPATSGYSAHCSTTEPHQYKFTTLPELWKSPRLIVLLSSALIFLDGNNGNANLILHYGRPVMAKLYSNLGLPTVHHQINRIGLHTVAVRLSVWLTVIVSFGQSACYCVFWSVCLLVIVSFGLTVCLAAYCCVFVFVSLFPCQRVNFDSFSNLNLSKVIPHASAVFQDQIQLLCR